MFKNSLIIVFAFFSVNSYAISNNEICAARADLMMFMATERDSGKSKKQVKQLVRGKFNNQLPKSFDAYLDAVYEGRRHKPSEIKTISLYSCYVEFGIIK